MSDTLLKFPSSQQVNVMNMLLSSMASSSGGMKLKSWHDLQELVRMGLHKKIPIGDAFTAERETNISISKANSTGITGASIDAATFLNAVGEAHAGIYEATYDGVAWHKEDGTAIILADYGISVTGTPVEGDHIVVTETASKLIFDVIDHDKECASGERSIVLLSRNIVAIDTIPFDAPELLYYTETGLAPGTYKLTLNHGTYGGGTTQDGTYYFTITQTIPAGGGFRHSSIGAWQSSYNTSQITSGKFTTYGAAPARTVIENNIVTSASGSDSAIDLGKFTARDAQYLNSTGDAATHNFTERNAYGSNYYKTSAARQWLNSSAASGWWSAQTVFDMPPSGNNLPGFLYGLDPELVDVIGTATIVCETPSPERTTGVANTYTLNDKVFLVSMTEVFGGNNISTTEGSRMAYYASEDRNAARIKYANGTARIWWMRSAFPGNANLVRNVYASGALNLYLASNAYGLVPGLIIKSKI